MRTDSDPAAQLNEAMMATLYVHHPYGIPVIGWGHEIEALSREDALAFYRRFYRPDNAILLVAGDITEAELRPLAEASYGAVVAPKGEKPVRTRLQEPPLRAARHVRLADDKVEQPTTQWAWLAPCSAHAEGEEAIALEVLSHVLGGSQTSHLYRALVLDQEIAVNCGAWYWNDALDMGQLGVYAVPAEGTSLETLDTAMAAIVQTLRDTLIEEGELARTKTRLIADMVYAQDNQTHLARIYGGVLTTGGSLADVRAWPGRIRAITPEQVRAAAQKWLDPKTRVSGHLVKAM